MLFYETVKRLRALAENPEPLLASVEGRVGHSPLSVVLQATEGRRRVVFVPPALTDRDNRLAMAALLEPLARRDGSPAQRDELPAEWRGLLGTLSAMAPLTLVIDEPGALAAVSRTFWRELGRAWGEVRESGAKVDIFLSSQERGLEERLNAPESPFREPAVHLQPAAGPPPVRVVRLGVGTHYDLAAAIPHWVGRDLLVGWSVFGGLPRSWGLVTRRRSPAAALRRGLLRGGRPLVDGPRALLDRAVGKANRYAAILRAVATGADHWRQLSERVGDDTGGSGSAGPYLAKLRELGMIDADRPVDAAPRARRNRYRLTDPHEAFWWSAIHPVRAGLLSAAPHPLPLPAGPLPRPASAFRGHGERVWKEAIRPKLPGAVLAALPMICRNYLRYGCEPVLGARARTVGPLWGSGFDFPVAGTLASGAICYGHIHPGPAPAPASMIDNLDRQIRATRYGYGRYARLRLIFSLTGFERELQRAAVRDAQVWLIGGEELAALPG